MKTFGKVCLHLFGILLWILMLFAVLDGADDVSHTLQVGDQAVSVEATITRADLHTEFDEGYEREYWKLYISYDYNGQHYSAVPYGSSQSEPTLGKKLTIKLDPDDPGNPLPDQAEFVLSMIMSPIFLAGLVCLAYLYLKSWLEKFFPQKQDSQAVKKWVYSIVGILLLLGNIFYHTQTQSLVFPGFTLAALAIIGLCMLWAKRSIKASPKTQPEPTAEQLP